MFPSVLHHQQLRIVPRDLACWYWWIVVCTRSSLEPQSFSASVAPWGQCCVCASTYRGRTAEDDLEFVGLSGIGSWLCETDQGSVGGHTVNSGQAVVRRRWSTGGTAGAASGRQMAGWAFKSYGAAWSEPWLLWRSRDLVVLLLESAARLGKYTKHACWQVWLLWRSRDLVVLLLESAARLGKYNKHACWQVWQSPHSLPGDSEQGSTGLPPSSKVTACWVSQLLSGNVSRFEENGCV